MNESFLILSDDKTKLLGIEESMREKITTLTIPHSVITIGEWALAQCIALTSICIPYGVRTIEECAFLECLALTSIHIPSSVTSIGFMAFAGCESLTSILIPDGVITLGTDICSCCSSLRFIHIPKSVINIGEAYHEDDPFLIDCDALERIYIPRGQKERFLNMRALAGFSHLIQEEGITTYSANKTCYFCRTTNIPDEASFCPNCGTRL